MARKASAGDTEQSLIDRCHHYDTPNDVPWDVQKCACMKHMLVNV